MGELVHMSLQVLLAHNKPATLPFNTAFPADMTMSKGNGQAGD